MFTGLVQAVGKVARVEIRGGAGSLFVEARELAPEVREGDSVAVNGVCLTATATKPTLGFEMIPETFSLTTLGGLKAGDGVNLELSLKASARLGGQLLQGHVDGTGKVSRVEKQSGQVLATIRANEEIMSLVVLKGSVAVDGVSLTTTSVTKGDFTVALIPYTLEKTTLGGLKVGRAVNIETDVIGKYVKNFLTRGGAGSITEGFLREHGFA